MSGASERREGHDSDDDCPAEESLNVTSSQSGEVETTEESGEDQREDTTQSFLQQNIENTLTPQMTRVSGLTEIQNEPEGQEHLYAEEQASRPSENNNSYQDIINESGEANGIARGIAHGDCNNTNHGIVNVYTFPEQRTEIIERVREILNEVLRITDDYLEDPTPDLSNEEEPPTPPSQ